MNEFSLIFQTKHIKIPSNFRFIDDVKDDILTALLKTRKYYVKSIVKEKTFNAFINQWVYGEHPEINFENISDFIKLSKEFDRMKDIIQIYQKYYINSQNLSLIDNYQLDTKKSELLKIIQ